MEKEQKLSLTRIITAGLLFLTALIIKKPDTLAFYYFLPAYLLAGYKVLLETGESLIHGELLDEDFLMAAASIGAFIIGKYPEAVAVMLFFEIGEWFEDIAVEKSRRSITKLTGLRPDTANVLRNGQVLTVEPSEVAIGEMILVRPGDRIPLDGVVTDGCCELNVSALTGESLPVSAEPGDCVSSGSIVLNRLIQIEVTKTLDDSTASRIIKLVEEAENNKSKSESFTTRFARIYTPIVCSAALLVAILPSLFTGEWSTWIYRGLLFLVVSCPCALVISVPLSFFAGIGGASKRGILIKGGQFIEMLSKATCIVFDKTGTLTSGKLNIKAVYPSDGITVKELIRLAASAEQYSSHPIATCICSASDSVLPASNVSEIAGKGVSALIDGKQILAGNIMLAKSYGLSPNKIIHAGGTAVYIFSNGKYIGCIIVGDMPKSNAAESIKRLMEMGVTETALLTGDTIEAGEELSQLLGLSSFKAELMPQDKVSALENIMSRSCDRITLYVGDGINDAPVLARADAGIAMGALGSDAAIEAADIVLMDDDPMKLPLAVSIARRTMRIVKQNILFALLIKAIVLILGALGKTSMWLAVFADVGVTVLAILNAMRCLNTPDK